MTLKNLALKGYDFFTFRSIAYSEGFNDEDIKGLLERGVE